jgi:hypothetical protein
MNKKMAETIILAKLYKDGFILMDEENKKVTINMKRGKLVRRYKESSYDDIIGILKRTAKGLKMGGYEVTIQQSALELIQDALSKDTTGDGFISKN